MAEIDLLKQRVANETGRREFEPSDVVVGVSPGRVSVTCGPFRRLCDSSGMISGASKCLIEISTGGFHLIRELPAADPFWKADFDVSGVDSRSYVVWTRVVDSSYKVLASCRVTAAVDLSSFIDIEVVDLRLETWKVQIDGDRIKLRLNRTANFGAFVKEELESGGLAGQALNDTQVLLMKSVVSSIVWQMCCQPPCDLREDWEAFVREVWSVTDDAPLPGDSDFAERLLEYAESVSEAFENYHQPLNSWKSAPVPVQP
jgi:hypothetical protein